MAELAPDYIPNRHRIVRASKSSWLQSRVVGIAPGTEDTSDGTPTVKCTYADGTSEIRTVASFRKGRKSRSRQTAPAPAPEPTEAERFLPSQADILGEYR